MFTRVVEESPGLVEAVALALSFFPEVEDKSLLLKTDCTLDIEYSRFKLDLTQKPPTSIVAEDSMQPARKGGNQYSYPV